jgi:histidinol-phosphate aminotransferase
MYAFDALLHGAESIDVPRDDRWQLDAGALIEAARGAKAVFIPSPNNPTGNLMPESLINPLLDSGALVVIDEAYIEFSDAASLAVRAAGEPALVVMRTLSKWGGLAGMRVGAAITAAETVELLLRTKQPYNLSVAAEVAAIASLEDAPLLDDRAATIVAERERMAAAVRELGWIEPWPSDASFLLCRLSGTNGLSLREALRRRGILTRYFDTDRLRDHLRFSMGTPEQNDRMLKALRECGEELGAAR